MRAKTRAWIDLAEQDLAAAQRLATDEYFGNISAYHAQQCVEKSFKAILEEHSARIPRSHATLPILAQIAELLPSFDPGASDSELALIDDVYTDVRYPGSRGLLPTGQPTSKEVAELLDIAQRAIGAAKKVLS